MRASGLLLSFLFALHAPAQAATPDPAHWQAVLAEARGQTVYFHAWAGDPQINGFIVWAGEQLQGQYGVSLQHVKIGDTAESVSRYSCREHCRESDAGQCGSALGQW